MSRWNSRLSSITHLVRWLQKNNPKGLQQVSQSLQEDLLSSVPEVVQGTVMKAAQSWYFGVDTGLTDYTLPRPNKVEAPSSAPVETWIGYLTGYRVWRIMEPGFLCSAVSSFIWPPGREGVSFDHFSESDHGIYAFKDYEACSEISGNVIGEVAMYGRIIECERGYRAQKAYPTKLYYKGKADKGIVEAVAERYGCAYEQRKAPVATAKEANSMLAQQLQHQIMSAALGNGYPYGAQQAKNYYGTSAALEKAKRQQNVARMEQLAKEARERVALNPGLIDPRFIA